MNSINLPKSFYPVAIIALLWNLMGLLAYFGYTTMDESGIAMLNEMQQEIYRNTPSWITYAFAIAVITGTLGSIALLMKKAWAHPLFLVSLLAVLVQNIYAWLCTPSIEANGILQGLIMPTLVVIIALYLFLFSKKAAVNQWIS